MNKKQDICLLIGIVVFVLLGFAPVRLLDIRYRRVPSSYLLMVAWAVTIVAAGWLIYRLRDKKVKNQRTSKKNK